MHRATPLHHVLAGVVRAVHPVHRAAGHRAPRLKYRAMHSIAVHPLAAKVWQQRRVNVQRATVPRVHAESAQVPSKTHKVHIVRQQCGVHSIIKRLGRFRRHDCYRNAMSSAPIRGTGISARHHTHGNHRWNLAARARMRNIDNGAPAPRGERTDSNSFGRRQLHAPVCHIRNDH